MNFQDSKIVAAQIKTSPDTFIWNWALGWSPLQIWATRTTYNSHTVRSNRMNQTSPKLVEQLICIQVGWIWTRHAAMLRSVCGSDLANMSGCHHSTLHVGWIRKACRKKGFWMCIFTQKTRRTSRHDDGLLQGRSDNQDDWEFSRSAHRLFWVAVRRTRPALGLIEITDIV